MHRGVAMTESGFPSPLGHAGTETFTSTSWPTDTIAMRRREKVERTLDSVLRKSDMGRRDYW